MQCSSIITILDITIITIIQWRCNWDVSSSSSAWSTTLPLLFVNTINHLHRHHHHHHLFVRIKMTQGDSVNLMCAHLVWERVHTKELYCGNVRWHHFVICVYETSRYDTVVWCWLMGNMWDSVKLWGSQYDRGGEGSMTEVSSVFKYALAGYVLECCMPRQTRGVLVVGSRPGMVVWPGEFSVL